MDKQLSSFAKLVLLGAGGLAIVAGPILYLFPNDTGTYFAWTIQHPLTPVFMGASYFAGIGNLIAVWENRWSLARVQLPAILMFTVTMLLATLLDLSIFNWSHPVAWAWLGVYLVSPLAAGLVMLRGERDYEATETQAQRLPGTFTPVMYALAFLSGLLGLFLFLAPERAASFWAWSITPLTGRVIGGWYLSSAALQFMLARQTSLRTARVGLLANVLVTSLLVIGALVHFSELNGPAVSVWFYMLLNLVLGGFSLYSWMKSN
jgi:hypothetical protein